jgi:hypothetical protein
MEIKDFKKIGRLLKQIYEELETQALKEGVNLLSPEYEELVNKARLAVLEKAGFTLEEYRTIKEQVSGIDKAGTLGVMQDTQKKLDATLSTIKEVQDRHIPTKEEITAIAREVAKEFIKPPEIINKIVDRVTIEKPQIIKETVKVREEYDATPLKKELQNLEKKVESIPPLPDLKKFREEITNEFSENFENNINALGMLDFRKMGMGLRQDIDERVIGSSDNRTVPKLTVGYTAPTNPKLYDLWYDLN